MVRLGPRLHTLRLQKKLTFEDIATDIKIKPVFLAAIERGEYSKLPSPAYAQGFVRNYASYLGLSKVEITALFKREFDEKKAYNVLPESLVKSKEFPLRHLRFQESLYVGIVIGLAIFLYLFFQYRSAFLPPSVTISSPTSDTVANQQLTVAGRTDSNATVTVNEQPVTVNNDGTFHKQITLFPGNATVTITATNRYGKETTIQRTVMVK